MTEWIQVVSESPDLMGEYLSILHTEGRYAETELSHLMKMIDRGDEMWIGRSGENRMALAFSFRPDGTGRLSNSVCDGPGTALFFCKEFIRKIREIADSYGIEVWRGRADVEYTNPLMNDLMQVAPDIVWELKGDPSRQGGMMVYEYFRCPACRSPELDERMEGPRVSGHDHESCVY